MERHIQGRQLDLLELASTAIQRQRLDPMMRTELTGLLKLLINECSAPLAKAKEAIASLATRQPPISPTCIHSFTGTTFRHISRRPFVI
jgi:hypothetical protein